MDSHIELFFVATAALFVVVDPIAAAPAFASLTAGRPAAETRSIVLRASLVGAGLLVFFTLFGGLLFRVLGVELSAFRAAGGLLLLLTALEMLRGRAVSCKKEETSGVAAGADIAIVPLATPLLAGPGAIATVMVLVTENGPSAPIAVILAIVATFAASYCVLRAANLVPRVLGRSGLALVQRVMGLVLASVAIQFMAEGGAQLFAAAV